MAPFKEKFDTYRQRAEAAIDRLLPPAWTRPGRLHAAMRYSMEAGGKRIRPVLLLAAQDLLGSGNDPGPAAVAVECVHTYSLIHDDLPAVDNSDLRRGRPACHVEYDEATALLAGDALLTYAFELLAGHYAAEPELLAGLVADLAAAAGSRQLIGGQMEDILSEDSRADAATLDYIHRNKTAALLAAPLTMGLRLAGGTPEQIEAIGDAGRHLGLAFQIVDDLLDATSDSQTMGKPTGSDAANGKSTYVALHGVSGARAAADAQTRRAIESLARVGGDHAFLVELARELAARTR